MGNDSMNNHKVAVIYPYVAHYRKPVFDALCRDPDIDYYIVSDQESQKRGQIYFPHDLDYRAQRITATSNPTWDFVYSHDAAGNIVSLADQTSVYSKSFSYDALYRLISDSHESGRWDYQYDANGNRTALTLNAAANPLVLSITYATNSNRISRSVFELPQVHDAAENLLSYGA